MSRRSTAGAVPERVRIREEGPRDGWQGIDSLFIPTDVKLAYIEALADAGLARISVTSMVSPRRVPQLADAFEVLRRLRARAGVRYGVLVPNRRGLDDLLRLRGDGAPIDDVTFTISVSERHSIANINMSVRDSLRELAASTAAAHDAGLWVSVGMATVFGDSLGGAVHLDDVLHLAASVADLGADELVLGDTTGMADPRSVVEVLTSLQAQVPNRRLTAHFHNTRGAALANVLAAWQVGIDSFETSYGELGGSPFAHGATGNVATEDLANMFEQMGVDTGVDVQAVVAVTQRTALLLGRDLDAHVSKVAAPRPA